MTNLLLDKKTRVAPRGWEGVQMESPQGMSLWDWYLTRTKTEQIILEEIIYYRLSEHLPLSEELMIQDIPLFRNPK